MILIQMRAWRKVEFMTTLDRSRLLADASGITWSQINLQNGDMILGQNLSPHHCEVVSPEE